MNTTTTTNTTVLAQFVYSADVQDVHVKLVELIREFRADSEALQDIRDAYLAYASDAPEEASDLFTTVAAIAPIAAHIEIVGAWVWAAAEDAEAIAALHAAGFLRAKNRSTGLRFFRKPFAGRKLRVNKVYGHAAARRIHGFIEVK